MGKLYSAVFSGSCTQTAYPLSPIKSLAPSPTVSPLPPSPPPPSELLQAASERSSDFPLHSHTPSSFVSPSSLPSPPPPSPPSQLLPAAPSNITQPLSLSPNSILEIREV